MLGSNEIGIKGFGNEDELAAPTKSYLPMCIRGPQAMRVWVLLAEGGVDASDLELLPVGSVWWLTLRITPVLHRFACMEFEFACVCGQKAPHSYTYQNTFSVIRHDGWYRRAICFVCCSLEDI